MAVPEYRDEVLITLASVNPPPNLSFKKRHIFLSKKSPTIQIGRTSKRKASLEAGKSNAWFDSAVMSRKHALLTLDAENQKVYIKDTDSLHGTYKNEIRLIMNENTEISTGDKLMFGTSIDRGMEKYPPTRLEATLKYGSLDPEDRGNCFRVPDESDCEGISSDEDQVQNSCKMLYSKRVRPAARAATPPKDSPIDLTCDENRVLLDEPRSQFQTALRLPKLGESLSLPASNDDSTPSDIGFWDDYQDEECDMDDGEDEEMGEDSHVDQTAFDDADDNFSVHSESSSVGDVDDNQDSVSADNGFDEGDEFDEEDLDVIDFGTSANYDAKATGDNPTQASSADSGTTSQKKDHATERQFKIVTTQPKFCNQRAKPNVLGPCAPAVPDTTPVSLPSISEWTPENWNYGSVSDYGPPLPTAVIMGKKTGKPEFFAAREANKSNARNLPMWAYSSFGNTQTTLPSQMQPQTVTEQLIHTPQGDRIDQLPPSSLTSSGARFLNTPQGPFHQVEPETVSTESVMDETSAFSFQQSKMSPVVDEPIIETLAHAVASQKNDQEDIQTLEDAAQVPIEAEINKNESVKGTDEVSESPKSSKRKAEEISELIAEEELIESDEPLYQQATCQPPKRPTGYLRREKQAGVTPPPPKRLRRMAEVVGYATLGGVAVMSALIATAPAL